MPRPEKVQAVADIKERLDEAAAVFVAEYAGLSVTEQQELRRGLRRAEAEFKVVKMTLARRAAEDLGHQGLLEMLEGPTGLAYTGGDPTVAAKALRDFTRDHDRLLIKGALLGGEVLPPEKVSELADLDPREVLLSRVAATLQEPLSTLARLLAALPRDTATVLRQLIEKRREAGEELEPAVEAASADEASAEETGAGAEMAAEHVEEPVAEEAGADEAAVVAAPEGEAKPDKADNTDEPAEEAEDEKAAAAEEE